ncbi:MAG: DUF1127 domain-containing protein [Paracoccaceae bacterium]
MAHIVTSGHAPSFSLFAPFAAIGRTLVRMAENNPQMKQIEKLNAISDAELERRGTTREAVVRHIFRDRYYI